MTDTAPELEELMSEREVYDKYGHLFVHKELLEARQKGQIDFYDLRKGVFYTPQQLRDYLAKKKAGPCPLNERPEAPEESVNNSASSNSKTNGSRRKRGAHLTTVPGWKEDESVGEALAQTISRKPSEN